MKYCYMVVKKLRCIIDLKFHLLNDKERMYKALVIEYNGVELDGV